MSEGNLKQVQCPRNGVKHLMEEQLIENKTFYVYNV